MILCEIYRSYLPFLARHARKRGTHGTLMRSDWQNDASGGSQPGEFLLPSLHYSPCTVAATMKFVSFNINGLRARPHQLAAIVEKHQPDVIGLQETKVHDDMFLSKRSPGSAITSFITGRKAIMASRC